MKRFLIPISLTLETEAGRFEFKGFRDAKPWLAALEAACRA